MKELFPIEIQENSIQNLFVKRHTKSKIIYWIILFSLLATCASLPFIYVDITSQSRSVVRGDNDNNTLQAALYSEVIKTNIHENKQIKAGDTLIWLRTDELNEQLLRLNSKIKENNEFIEDLRRLIRGGTSMATPKYLTDLAHYQARLIEKTTILKQTLNEYQTSRFLYEKGVESEFDYKQSESRYQTEKSQLALLKQQQINSWEAERTRLEYENRDINSELLQIGQRKTQYAITAPISGYIVKYTGLQVGNFLSPGQTIAQITSTDSLLIECYVSPSDIGYIRTGQKIKLQVDAFNYQQWGLLNGVVEDIISDVTEINNQPYFKVKCTLDKNYLELSNGYKGELKKGMSGTTRFFLTRRSLAQLLFDKVNDWVNPKIMN